MAQFQTEERGKRRQLTEDAVALAMHNRWQEAVSVNKQIIDLFPDDVEAYNRQGRAYTELGSYQEARAAYSKALGLDPNNLIAQKNLQRLADLTPQPAPEPTIHRLDPRLFTGETGKTGVLSLVRGSDREALSQMNIGDQVYLQAEGRALWVRTAAGQNIGQAEPRPSQRLIDLMNGGNRYAAAVVSLEEGQVRIIVQEVYQAPELVGKVSFPPRSAAATAVRPYLRDTMFHYGLEEDEELEEGDYGGEAAGETEELAEEPEVGVEDQETI